MIKKIAFIASCGYSGSTLLELILCSHEKTIGIGEAFQLVDPKGISIDQIPQRPCACGNPISDCRFWDRAIESLREAAALQPHQKYQKFINTVNQLFSSKEILVDSSKLPKALALVKKIHGIDLRVLHLVRDVRAYGVSMKKSYWRNKKYSTKKGLKQLIRYLKHTQMYNFNYWYLLNKRIEEYCRKHSIPILLVRYEELCFNTEKALENIGNFLNINLVYKSLKFEETNSHNVFGNRMRHDPIKNKRIIYDFRWLDRNDWAIPSIIFPYVMSYYKNLAIKE
jgi:hypothetical protein